MPPFLCVLTQWSDDGTLFAETCHQGLQLLS